MGNHGNGIPIFQVDAFTDRPFSGNPAGIVVLEHPPGEGWMQQVAAEMNLSETAFLWPQLGGFGIRWFTPVAEVALCGHATLASAHVLWESGRLPIERSARFFSASGELGARRRQEWIELDFPALPARPSETPPGLAAVLGIEPIAVGRSRDDLLVVLPDAAAVRALAPDLAALAALPARGVIVTAASDDPRYDFISRFFAPAVGVAEDPVTGSAHCCLAPYWAEKLGRDRLRAFQASRRGGELELRVVGDRVELAGQAITVLRGDLLVRR